VIVMRSTPQLGGLWDSVTGAVTSAVKTAATVAVAPIKYGTQLNIAAGKALLSTAAPLVKSAASVAGKAATTVLKDVGQTVAAVKGGGAYVPPPPSDNMPIILAGVAAAGILGFAVLRRHRA
jgi:hypothetical protein